MKIFETKIVILIAIGYLLAATAALPWTLRVFLQIDPQETTLLSAGAILALPAAFLAIAVPIHYTVKQRKEDENSRRKNVLITLARLIGAELDSNYGLLQQLEKSLKEGYDKMPEILEAGDEGKISAKISIVRLIATELTNRINDSMYKSVISSGILVDIADDEVCDAFGETYTLLSDLVARARHIYLFFTMLQNPQPGDQVARVVARMKEEKMSPSIAYLQLDMQRGIKSIEDTVNKLNQVLKHYGKEFILGAEMTDEEMRSVNVK